MAFVKPFDAKQISEEYFVDFNFSALIGSNTVASAVVTATDTADDSVVTSSVTTVANQVVTSPRVYVWVKGGTAGHTYKIECLATDSAGQIWELSGTIQTVA